jgi:hypothetical protein
MDNGKVIKYLIKPCLYRAILFYICSDIRLAS